MDDSQQKAQIDEEARITKEEADKKAVDLRQALADQESQTVRQEAEDKVAQIQNDAQK